VSILAALLAFAALWALGAAALALAGVRARGAPGVLATDFAAGAAILACSGAILIALGLQVSLPVFYTLLVALALAVLWRRRSRRAARELPGGSVAAACPVVQALGLRRAFPRDRWAAALLGATAVLLLGIAAAAAFDRLWWDGWAIWALKARVLFLDGTLPRAFLDPAGPWAFTHVDYPLAVPLVHWWVYRHAGAAAPQLASLAGFVWHALIPLLTWGALRERAGERTAAAAALATAAFWPIAFHATGGTADVVIAFALLGAVVELDRALGRGDRAALWRAGVFLALGAAAKNEGLALAVVGLAAGLLARGGIGRARRLPALLLPLAVAAPWLLFSRANGLESDVLAGWPGTEAAARRAWQLAGGLLRQFTGTPWQPAAALAVVGVIAAARRRDPGLTAGWLLLGGYAAALCGVYIIAPHDLAWLMATSLPRTFGALVPATLFLALAGAAPAPAATATSTADARIAAQEPDRVPA